MFEAAREDDLPAIAATITRLRLDGEDLQASQFIVVRDGDGLAAFGRIKPYGDGVFELGSVAVLETARGRGLGAALVRELIRRFPVEDVWITTDLVDYFARLGFTERADAPPAIRGKLDRICGKLRQGVVAMWRGR